MRNPMLLVALLLTMLALSPRPAQAIRCCDINDSTSTNVGTGSTCATAQANLKAICDAEARGVCGGPRNTCLGGITYTDDCYDNPGGGLASSGYEPFGCFYTCVP
jgi:hypothetical protein